MMKIMVRGYTINGKEVVVAAGGNEFDAMTITVCMKKWQVERQSVFKIARFTDKKEVIWPL